MFTIAKNTIFLTTEKYFKCYIQRLRYFAFVFLVIADVFEFFWCYANISSQKIPIYKLVHVNSPSLAGSPTLYPSQYTSLPPSPTLYLFQYTFLPPSLALPLSSPTKPPPSLSHSLPFPMHLPLPLSTLSNAPSSPKVLEP